ncbi:MAG: sigma-70 family RNA polymerase sigma factor [Verrucomicrobiales bacterium]|nr:sigma-70 family RNA polymerase sigma factor [Verrucomicrobiales bacterium]
MTTDAQLLREFAATDSESAFTELVGRHGPAVHAAALRQTGNPHHAEEVTQAVFLLLARKAAALSGQAVLIGWLMKATQFAARDLLRGERRRLERETTAYHMNESLEPSMAADPDSERLWDRISPVLDGCLARLREADRNAILLRFFQNRSLAEVGGALGVAEEAARKRVNRALERLRSELQRDGAVASLAVLPELLSRQAVPTGPSELVGSTVSAVLRSGGDGGVRAAALSKSLGRDLAWSGLRVWFATAATAAVLVGGVLWVGETVWSRVSTPLVTADGDYRVAGFPDPRVVHRFIRDLQRELRAGERETVARWIRYPLKVHGRGTVSAVEGPSGVLASFERVFTESVAGEILKCPAQRLHCTPEGVMIGGGSVWIAPEPGTGEPRIALINLP